MSNNAYTNERIKKEPLGNTMWLRATRSGAVPVSTLARFSLQRARRGLSPGQKTYQRQSFHGIPDFLHFLLRRAQRKGVAHMEAPPKVKMRFWWKTKRTEYVMDPCAIHDILSLRKSEPDRVLLAVKPALKELHFTPPL